MMRCWFLLLPALTGACAGDPERERAAMEAALLSARQSVAAARGATGGPPVAPRAAARARAEPVLRAEPQAANPAAGAAPRAASQLLGAGPEALVAALGEPALRREEGSAAVWLYSGAGCHLDIVLYPTRDGLRVAHVQARAGGIAQRSEATCLRELAAQQRRPPPAGLGERHSQA